MLNLKVLTVVWLFRLRAWKVEDKVESESVDCCMFILFIQAEGMES